MLGPAARIVAMNFFIALPAFFFLYAEGLKPCQLPTEAAFSALPEATSAPGDLTGVESGSPLQGVPSPRWPEDLGQTWEVMRDHKVPWIAMGEHTFGTKSKSS